jgi:hypothetical protein
MSAERPETCHQDRENGKAILVGFAIVAVLGFFIVVGLGTLNRHLDDQATATQDLVTATEDLEDIVEGVHESLAIGRYERILFQIDQRKLVCLDLQDGDSGATDEQVEECDEDYIELPPRPEGYDG